MDEGLKNFTSDKKQTVLPFAVPKLSYLPDDDNYYWVHTIEGIATSKIDPEDFRVLVRLIRMPSDGADLDRTPVFERISVHVPLADFRFFGMGARFQYQRQIDRAWSHKTESILSLKSHRFVDAFIGRKSLSEPAAVHVHNTYTFSDVELVNIQEGGPYLESMYRGRLIYFPMMELVRFYFSNFDRLSRRLIMIHAFPERGLKLPWIADETGSDGEIFVLTPTIEFSDHATCVQLAIFLSSPDLQTIMSELGTVVRRQVLAGRGAAPLLEFPRNAKNLRVSIRDTMVKRKNGKFEKARMVAQIISDNRDMPFERLVIRDPRIAENDETNQVQGPPQLPTKKTDEGQDGNKRSQKLDGKDLYGDRVEYLRPPGLKDAFPGIERASIKIDYTSPPSRKPKKPSWLQSMKEIFIPKPNGGTKPGRPPPAISYRSPLRTSTRGGRRTFLRQSGLKLFLPLQIKAPDVRELDEVDLDNRCLITVKAINQLFKKQSRFGYKGEKVRFERPRAICTKLSLDGGAARERIIVYSRFTVDGFHGVVLELQRLKEQSFAMGVVLRSDGHELEMADIKRILNHCERRVSLRGSNEREGRDSYAGVWPSYRDYDDVQGTRLVHKPPLDDPFYLADAIKKAALKLSSQASRETNS